MYPHFIEVHQNGIPMILNVDQIICASDKCDKKEWQSVAMVTGCSVDEAWGLDETYDELKELITNAGCHIEKGDPRLDQTKPLTMNDLKDMVGQPVWDSNTDTWLLVYEGDWTYTPDPDRVCVRVVNRYGCNKIWLSEKDLIAKPLYRMKR